MIINRPEDSIHKAHLLRTLTHIADNPILSRSLSFKGGTCASVIGILDRFSVDLDFDAQGDEDILRQEFHQIFQDLDYRIHDESKNALEFFVKYSAPDNQRNTLKIDALPNTVQTNKYASVFLPEINRTMNCQTTDTIFANKLVAVQDRYLKRKSIAGRDIYDIHHFFLKNLEYNQEVILERTKLSTKEYLVWLRNFIDKKVSLKLIDQDLNSLLPVKSFQKIRKTLKEETLVLLDDEIKKY